MINSTVRINSKRFVDELNTFIYNAQSKRAEAQKGKHDDAIMAISIALHVRDIRMRGMPIGADVPEEITNVFRSEIYEDIRREIMDGSPEDWITQESDDPILMPDEKDIMSPIMFDFKRKNDALLKEFGWAVIPPILWLCDFLINLGGSTLC